ncbi:radical SAM protein [Moraxella osloensis]|uniref:radical SAM protein n=1 Tax=Faucicola osloensis TaxID=34062 RepID=UPI00200462F7|nr:radical SAM protein [Moraxella osloensis]MCK6053468.1 radical SAM protein [Moraxella osloensis]
MDECSLLDSPKTIDWFVTSLCNLDCSFCYGPYPTNENKDIAKQIAVKLVDSNTKNVTLCGGEPFIKKDIEEIIDILIEGKKNVFVSTNGHFPNQLQNVINKLSGISISLDASNETLTHQIRGENAKFDKILKSLLLVSKEHPQKLKITTVISKKNLNDLGNIANLVSSYRPAIWRLLQFVPRMKGYEYQEEYAIQSDVFINAVQELKSSHPDLNIHSSEIEYIDTCFIVDSFGNILSPAKENYKIVGNCFEDNIDLCWSKYWTQKTIHHTNKIWMQEISQ